MTKATTKIIHVNPQGFVAAVSFIDEPVAAYGELREVPIDLEIGVGDKAPEVAEAPEAPAVKKSKARVE